MKTQNQKIAKHLKSGKWLDADKCRKLYGVAQSDYDRRISDFKAMHPDYHIIGLWVRTGSGVRYKKHRARLNKGGLDSKHYAIMKKALTAEQYRNFCNEVNDPDMSSINYTPDSILFYSFEWDNTHNGSKYWSKIYLKLENDRVREYLGCIAK